MNIPSYMNKVTTLSKIVALTLFIFLPFIGFFIGWGFKNNIETIYKGCGESLKSVPVLPNGDNSVKGTFSINFSKCESFRDTVSFGFGSTTYEITKSQVNNLCVMRYGTEIENPNWDGSLNITCNIPTNTGTKTFNITDQGIDFSSISSYCR